MDILTLLDQKVAQVNVDVRKVYLDSRIGFLCRVQFFDYKIINEYSKEKKKEASLHYKFVFRIGTPTI